MVRFVLPLTLILGCQRLPPSTGTTPSGDADTDTDADTDSDSDSDTDGPTLRIVHWNIQFTGTVNSDEYNATVGILARLNGDVVALNEVDGDEGDELVEMADSLGYDITFFPSSNPYGYQRNAIMARIPVELLTDWTPAELSNDSRANDVTRYPVGVRLRPDDGDPIALVSTHLNSGFGDEEEFKRAVDIIRSTQAVLEYGDERMLLMGDFNAEVDDRDTGSWSRQPSGMSSSYVLGSDLVDLLASDGISADPFAPIEDAGLIIVDALQLDGRDATREESWRRLDYAYASQAIHDAGLVSEVYDPRDEGRGGIEKFGATPGRDDATIASDHLPVVVEFRQ
jgi:endonuclease/exonuclease/phosphatase family metal-dependent hydrolase